MKKPTCTFSYVPYNVHIVFFHSYLKETKKINSQFLTNSSMFFCFEDSLNMDFTLQYQNAYNQVMH